MSQASEPAVDASPPDSPIHLRGTDHIALEGTDTAATITYYRDLLGCPLVLRQPNLDREELTHLFFDTGDGRLIFVFVSDERDPVDLPPPEPGQVHHLAFRIDGGRLDEIAAALDGAGYPVFEYDRGAFHSLYTEDPNGLTLELVADKFAVPDDKRAAVLTRAHERRMQDGAAFVENEHMRTAIDELDVDAEEPDARAAPTGRDF